MEKDSLGVKKKKVYKEKEKLITLCETEKSSHSPALLGRTFGNAFGRRITVVQLYTCSPFYTKTTPLQKHFQKEIFPQFLKIFTFFMLILTVFVFSSEAEGHLPSQNPAAYSGPPLLPWDEGWGEADNSPTSPPLPTSPAGQCKSCSLNKRRGGEFLWPRNKT